MSSPRSAAPVEIVEVAPRDGLQNETAHPVAPTEKVAAHRTGWSRRACAGSRRWASPTRPGAADGRRRGGARRPCPAARGVSWIGLVLNRRGLDRALARRGGRGQRGGGRHRRVLPAQPGHDRGRVDRPVGAVAAAPAAAGVRTTVTVAAAFGCPFTGEVPVGAVTEVLRRCAEARPGRDLPRRHHRRRRAEAGRGAGRRRRRPRRVSVCARTSTTPGTPGTPTRCRVAARRRRAVPVALDSSVGGIGGCPFAPAATGNIATEDLLYLLQRSGAALDVDVDELRRSGRGWGGSSGIPSQHSWAGPAGSLLSRPTSARTARRPGPARCGCPWPRPGRR